jgi:hypothetical protein
MISLLDYSQLVCQDDFHYRSIPPSSLNSNIHTAGTPILAPALGIHKQHPSLSKGPGQHLLQQYRHTPLRVKVISTPLDEGFRALFPGALGIRDREPFCTIWVSRMR